MKNPNGLCECGCGSQTKLAKGYHRRLGYQPGEPLRFVNGHNASKLSDDTYIPPPNPSGLCLCGCGEKTRLATANWRRYGWVKGEPIRFIRGHSGYKLPKEEDHPNWTGGKSSYRARALKEYGPVCAICGYGKYVQLLWVHHKNLKSTKAQDNHLLDNLEVLCVRCHLEKHVESETGSYSGLTEIQAKNLGLV